MTVFLSPHLDDAVFSCGGFIWEQVRSGEQVEIWSIFTADPPPGPQTPFTESLHARWGAEEHAMAHRREEDRQACLRLGVNPRHFDLQDCIYRRLPDGQPLIQAEEDLWQAVHPLEERLVGKLGDKIQAGLSSGATLVAPMAIGRHVDHSLVRKVARRLANLLPELAVFYYADLPYVLKDPSGLQPWLEAGYNQVPGQISAHGLAAWQDAVAAYSSQMSTFWADDGAMRSALAEYWSQGLGRIWGHTCSALISPPARLITSQ